MPERPIERESRRAPAVLIARGILRALEWHTPAWVVCLEIRILYNTMSRAFGVPEKKIPLWYAGQALRDYAAYSARCLMRCEADPGRIYREAYRTGEQVRRLTGFTEKEDLQRLIFYLYRNIGILMEGHLPGEVTVSRCYFSRFYTPEQCALMSYMDSGMIAGILGGGKLEFTERITEGSGKPEYTEHVTEGSGKPEYTEHITEGCRRCKAFFVDNA